MSWFLEVFVHGGIELFLWFLIRFRGLHSQNLWRWYQCHWGKVDLTWFFLFFWWVFAVLWCYFDILIWVFVIGLFYHLWRYPLSLLVRVGVYLWWFYSFLVLIGGVLCLCVLLGGKSRYIILKKLCFLCINNKQLIIYKCVLIYQSTVYSGFFF